jgi:hypothetical protein
LPAGNYVIQDNQSFTMALVWSGIWNHYATIFGDMFYVNGDDDNNNNM